MVASAAPPWLNDAKLAAQKYTEAVVVAVEKCARDTAGQTCYICKGYTGTLVRGCACRGAAGIAHVSCLAYQARSLVEFGVDNRLGDASLQARFDRWSTCRLCERDYHGVVACALGWACWKTYVGRPEADRFRRLAMHVLLGGLHEAGQDEDALSVGEAQLSTLRRVGDPDTNMLVAQGNLAVLYQNVGRNEEALHLRRDVYYGYFRLYGQDRRALGAATCYASSLIDLQRFKEAKSLFRKAIPVARRVLGEGDEITLRMGALYAMASRGDAVAGDGPERAAATAWTPADEEELAALRRKAARRAREEAARREREEAAERQRQEAAAALRRQEAAANKAQEADKRRAEARPPAGMTGLEMQSWQRRAIDRILDIDAEKEPDMILGVRWGAPKHEVKKAYKALAMLFHPDKCSAPDASDAMQKINTARQKLFLAATSERECAPPPPPPRTPSTSSTPPPRSSPPPPPRSPSTPSPPRPTDSERCIIQ